MTPFVPGSNALPLKWFRHPPRGRWVYTVDRFAAEKGPAQVTLGVNAWFDSSCRIRPKHPISLTCYMGSVGYIYEEELPEWVIERMAVLKIVEEGAYVEQVGVRYDQIQWRTENKRSYAVTERAVVHENRWYMLDVYTP